MTVRLNSKNLHFAHSDVVVPNYDRSSVVNGIVHIGVGNFHRGHQAVFTDDVLSSGDLSWGITGISLRSSNVREMLLPQDFLYSVGFQDDQTNELRVIGSITNVLSAPQGPKDVLNVLCDERTKVVTLTITEKGYVWPDDEIPIWDPLAFHRFSAPALLYLVQALHLRKKQGIPAFTILSCDNLASNGRVLKSAILRLAAQKDETLSSSLVETLACPCSMVDRIVPSSSEEGRLAISERLGLEDQAPINTEPFAQWIIEDSFPTGRPDWSMSNGVVFTSDVTPYEDMKLRLLNGAHTFIALYGQLTNRRYVSDVLKSGVALKFLECFWEQAKKTIEIDHDLNSYTQTLVRRFRNPSIFHETAQIVSDTSQKLPQRIVEPIITLDKMGSETFAHNAVIAMWFHFLSKSASINDPLSQELAAFRGSTNIKKFVNEVDAFSRRYRESSRLIAEVEAIYKGLSSRILDAFLNEITG